VTQRWEKKLRNVKTITRAVVSATGYVQRISFRRKWYLIKIQISI